MRALLLVVILASLATAETIDGQVVDLPAGRSSAPLTIGSRGATLRATAACELAGAITLEALGTGGLDATAIGHSLRAVVQDDWRDTQTAAGRTHVTAVKHPSPEFGPDLFKAWAIRGQVRNWDDFSLQWDGYISIPDSADLATNSDDGSRVWLDLDGDGVVDPGEWGSNGWGGGQGTTQRTVHSRVPPGIYHIRVQYEDGGGGNSMELLWRLPGRPMVPVPAEAFLAAPTLTLEGPITLAAPVAGTGMLRLKNGVRLASAPRTGIVSFAGAVALAADLDLGGVRCSFPDGGRLDLAGHALRLGTGLGGGTILLGGGHLSLQPGLSPLRIDGSGEIELTGDTSVAWFGDQVRVSGGSLRSPGRSVVRTGISAPLATVIPLTDTGDGPRILEAGIEVPPGAPAGLGIGAWRADRQGRWFQRINPGTLAPGSHRLRFDLGAGAQLSPEGHRGEWGGDAAADAGHIGLFLYATVPSTAIVTIDAHLLPSAAASDAEAGSSLTDLRTSGSEALTGRRWSLSLRPEPYPADPYDSEAFALDLAVTGPDGTVTHFAGFHDEPAESVDRGDREEFRTTGEPHFAVRFRPTLPGVHHLALTARWAGRPPLTVALPDLTATGRPWDDIARVDSRDPRFFSAGGAFVWPAGCNLHSIYDVRSKGSLQTRLTPDRGSFARDAYLERLAAGGGTGCEIWLSPWSLGLEWIPEWPGYRGAGRYHTGHAAALDRILDRAEALGVRVNLVLYNHGMARDGAEPEQDWKFHPYAAVQGGWLNTPASLFSDDRAFAYQSRMFRYLAARYGDSPALLGWKLWAEVNLAQAPGHDVQAWHRRAIAAMNQADPWRHPITTHWSGDWNTPDRAIASLPGLNYVCIDAYKGDDTDIASLLCRSTRDPTRPGQGLSGLVKPVVVTEFGGNWMATSRRRMAAEHAIGPWAGLVSGHAASPMLWWFEWIDQEDRFGVYGAINRFLAGEDPRDPAATCIAPAVAGDRMWCRAWSRPGRALGYLLDNAWGTGGPERAIANTSIRIGEAVAAGTMAVEWWDPDLGRMVSSQRIEHLGGILELATPEFRRHLAFKLYRTEPAEGGATSSR